MNRVCHPHDLLWVQSLVSTSPPPDWLNVDDLSLRPVVVRRAPMLADQIPVGVRGSSRSERYGCHVASAAIIRSITPEQLVNQKRWRQLLQDQTPTQQCQTQENYCPQWTVIELIDEILQYYGIVWGITGSCGFELATGLKTITPMSDIDIRILCPQPVEHSYFQHVQQHLSQLPCNIGKQNIDIQLETPVGAFALSEWLRSPGAVMIKSNTGPYITATPWSP